MPYHLKNRTFSLALSQLEEMIQAAPSQARLFTPDGALLARPWQTLLSSISGYQPLDLDLTLELEKSRALGLPGSWFRLQSHPEMPTEVILQPTGELLHLLPLFSTELKSSALLACDPNFRVVGATSEAENLLLFAAQHRLVGASLDRLLGLPLPADRRRVETELLLPIDRREQVLIQCQLEPHVDFTGRASGWLVRLRYEPFFNPPEQSDWQHLLEYFPGVVVKLNEHGQILFANRQVGNLRVEDMRGHNIFELVPPEYQVTVKNFRYSIVRERQALSGEVPVRDKGSRELIWFRFSATPLLNEDEVEVLVYATDISLHKQTAEELKASRQQVRSLASLLDQTQEKERLRISRELHDELGGSLTALRLEVGALQRLAELPESMKGRLTGIDGLLEETIATVRRLSTQLRPPILDDLGLAAALESMLDTAARRSGFTHTLRVQDPLPGDTELHLHLFRICQEAVTNICRHARANKVRVHLSRPYRGTLELLVEDDGRGFETSGPSGSQSLGHAGIAERVQLLGGSFEITSRPGHGCRLVAYVPVKDEPQSL